MSQSISTSLSLLTHSPNSLTNLSSSSQYKQFNNNNSYKCSDYLSLPKHEKHNVKECFYHGLYSGLRSYTGVYSFKACLTLVFALFSGKLQANASSIQGCIIDSHSDTHNFASFIAVCSSSYHLSN